MDQEGKDKGKYDSSKIYKVKYSINLLPMLGFYVHKEVDPYTNEVSTEFKNLDANLLGLCAESEEMSMFEAESLKDLIEFKWNSYAKNFHLFGCIYHIGYIWILLVYTKFVYIIGPVDHEG